MTLHLAQLIAVANFGNEFLINLRPAVELQPDGRLFRHSNTVIVSNGSETDLRAWLYALRQSGCKQLLLHALPVNILPEMPDHLAAAFENGGSRWFIQADFSDKTYLWYSEWQLTNPDAPDGRIYTVTFREHTPPPSLNLQPIAAEEVKKNFQKTLHDITQFATQQNLPHWQSVFQKALTALDNPDPQRLTYLNDLLNFRPANLSAGQLLAASILAWVFGGMGSWNDVYIEKDDDYAHYQKLSAELFSCISRAVQAAVYASAKNAASNL